MRREKRENNSQRGGNQPASAGQNQSRFAVEAFFRIRIDGDFQQRCEHVQKRNQLQHHGQRQQPLKRFLHARSDRIHDDQNNRHHALNDQRHVRRRESRMRFPQPAGHVRIKPSHEWNTRRTGEPGRPNPRDGNTQHQRKRSDDPIGADAAGHVADGLHNSLQHVDVVLAHRDQQRQRSRDVHYAGKNPAPGHGARQRLLRILDFIAHHRCQFQTHQPKANHPKRIQHESRIRRNPEISSGHRGPKLGEDDHAQPNQNRCGDGGTDSAQIVDPLPHAQPHDIQNHQQRHQTHRRDHRKYFIVGQRRVARPQHKNRNADEIEHHRRHVHHVVGPVAPARQKAMKISEDFLGP